jgi:hypothetical protein
MNILLENKLNNIAKSYLNEKDDTLSYLGEYLAARRGIELEEAKELIEMIENEEKMLTEVIDKAASDAIKKLAESLNSVKKSIMHEQYSDADIAAIKAEVKKHAKKAVEKAKQYAPKASQEVGKFIGSVKYNAHKQYAHKALKDIKGWASKQKTNIKGMSNKKKLAVGAALVGVGHIAGGIKKYVKHRKENKDKQD